MKIVEQVNKIGNSKSSVKLIYSNRKSNISKDKNKEETINNLSLNEVKQFVEAHIPIKIKSSNKFIYPFINNDAYDTVVKSLTLSIHQKLPKLKSRELLFVEEVSIQQNTLPNRNLKVMIYKAKNSEGIEAYYNKSNNVFLLNNGDSLTPFEIFSWKKK